MGCGPGDYALEAAAAVGASGTVRALEKDPGRIEALNTEAQRRGLLHLQAMAADITEPLPVRDHCMDVCLIATVLHIPAVTEHMRSIFAEIRRVLKPEGRLAIIECKKEQTQFGPPMQMRLSPDDITHSIKNCGFKKLNIVDLGMNYMMLFGVKGFTSPSLTAGNRKDS
jgi:ubiquinone/menaquinone biosynthesis C-methylase UbiE